MKIAKNRNFIAAGQQMSDWLLRQAKSADAAALSECVQAAYRHYIPRMGKPADVGKIIATLATGGMPYTTGHTIMADAGLN